MDGKRVMLDKMKIAAGFSFEKPQFLLLSDFPRNIDTCQRKQTWSARLIGKILQKALL